MAGYQPAVNATHTVSSHSSRKKSTCCKLESHVMLRLPASLRRPNYVFWHLPLPLVYVKRPKVSVKGYSHRKRFPWNVAFSLCCTAMSHFAWCPTVCLAWAQAELHVVQQATLVDIRCLCLTYWHIKLQWLMSLCRYSVHVILNLKNSVRNHIVEKQSQFYCKCRSLVLRQVNEKLNLPFPFLSAASFFQCLSAAICAAEVSVM